MTPKEKSEELFVKFYPNWYDNGLVVKRKYAKQCALICVDEKINLLREIILQFHLDEDYQALEIYRNIKEVKQEIEKL